MRGFPPVCICGECLLRWMFASDFDYLIFYFISITSIVGGCQKSVEVELSKPLALSSLSNSRETKKGFKVKQCM